MKLIEERNRLIKIRIFKQGSNQWRLLPVEKRDGSSIRRGEITFRGDEEKFRKLLMKLKAKDVETDPPSVKGKTYQQMIDTAKDGSDPYIWVWLNIWNKYRNDNKLTIAERQKRLISSEFLSNYLDDFLNFFEKNVYTGINKVLTALDEFLQMHGLILSEEEFDNVVGVLENRYIMENKEIKENYTIKHPTFTSAISEVIDFLKRKNFYLSEDDVFNEITTGRGRPKNGDTVRFNMPLYNRDGTPAKKAVAFQIADLENGLYELNMYITPLKLKEYPYEQVEIHEEVEKVITLEASLRIGDVLLEKGDTIRVLDEKIGPRDWPKLSKAIKKELGYNVVVDSNTGGLYPIIKIYIGKTESARISTKSGRITGDVNVKKKLKPIVDKFNK